MGRTLVVSRAIKLFPRYKQELEEFKFTDIVFTNARKDGLIMKIREVNPALLMIDAGFYEAGTPSMIGEIRKLFPKLNIAVVAREDYPAGKGVFFIYHGVNSYISLWEGYEEFCKGMKEVREGRTYLSPLVQYLYDHDEITSDISNKYANSSRQHEILVMLCCGLAIEEIGDNLHITQKTVYNHIGFLYDTFHASSREEMIAIAWELELVTKHDIRFYSKKKYDFELPEWAVKIINNNKLLRERPDYDY